MKKALTGSMLAFTLVLAALPASAHFIWIERDGTGPARVYFGEFGEGLREREGNALSKVKTVRAFQGGSKLTLPSVRKDDHILFKAKGFDDVRLIEDGFAIRENKETGQKSKAVFYARAGRKETLSMLDFELVPVQADGSVFELRFKGAPVAGAEIEAYGPDKWEQKFTTGTDGKVEIPATASGRYVIRASHSEPAVDGVIPRHIFTLSYVIQ